MRRVSWLVVCVPLLSAQAMAPQDKSQEDVETLIRKLDSDRWAERERATSELARRGTSVAGPLKAALKAGKLPLEAKRRAEWILFRIDVPESGAVWRDTPHTEPYEGIKDGDVIVECDGKPVRTVAELVRALRQRRTCKLKAWRLGEGPFEAVAKIDTPRMSGLRTWPDAQELYTRFGHKGNWDGDVIKALRLTYDGKPEAKNFYEAAWKAGCRDCLVAAFWMWELRLAGSNEKAQKLWKDTLSGQIRGTYPGGYWRHGKIPYELVHLELVAGRRKQADRALADAIEQAVKADAWAGLACLRAAELELKLEDSPAEAVKLWREHMRGATQSPLGPRYDLAILLAQRLASEGDPKPALEFAEELPDCLTKSLLVTYYQGQVAAEWSARSFKPSRPHMVPVKWIESLGPLEAPLDRWYPHVLGILPCPARIDCEMRIVSYLTERSAWSREAGVRLDTVNNSGIVADAKLCWTGAVSCEYYVGRSVDSAGPTIVDPRQWQAFSLEAREMLTRITVNQRPHKTRYWNYVLSKNMKAVVYPFEATAEFRNITLYVGSGVKTDNAALKRLLKGFVKSTHSCDLNAAEGFATKLTDILGKVPEAKAYVEEITAAVARLRAIMSPRGLRLCTKQVFDLAEQEDGKWELRDGCLIARPDVEHGYHSAVLRLRQSLPDTELLGVVEFRNPGEKTNAEFFWNAGDDRDAAFTSLGANIHHRGKAGLSLWREDERTHRGPQAQINVTGPVPFCLRVRGKEAVLFVNDPNKPVAAVSGIKPTGWNLYVWGGYLNPDTEVHFTDLVVRHLPKDRKLDAPAELPKVPNKQPQSQPAK